MKLFLCFLCVVLLFVSTTDSVFAKVPSRLIVSPAYQQVTLEHGVSEVVSMITLTNNTADTVKIDLFAIDFTQVDTVGGIGFGSAVSQDSYRFARYIKLEPAKLELQSGEFKEIQAIIKDNPSLSPGGHYAAIVARFATDVQVTNRQILPGLSSLVLLRKLGGEHYNLTLSHVDALPSFTVQLPTKVPIQFENNGNIQVIPYGTIELKDIFGRVVAHGMMNEASYIVLAQTKREMVVPLKRTARSFPLMLYTVRIAGKTDTGGIVFSQEESFVYIWPGLIVGLTIGVVGTVYSIVRRHHKRRGGKKI